MPRLAVAFIVVIGSILWGVGCKQQVNETPLLRPRFLNFTVSPSSVQFTPIEGIRDTTLLITLSGIISGDPNPDFTGFSVIEGDEILHQSTFELSSDPTKGGFDFNAAFSFSTNTTDMRSIDLILLAYNENGEGERLFAKLSIRGFATQAPKLQSVSNPETVTIPISGIQEIRFEAKAVHPIGQHLMDGVFLFLVDSKANRIPSDGSSFRLFDDGIKEVASGKDDAVAGDSLYTLLLAINNQNSADTYDVYWYPKDQSGLIGDTLQTELRIVEP